MGENWEHQDRLGRDFAAGATGDFGGDAVGDFGGGDFGGGDFNGGYPPEGEEYYGEKRKKKKEKKEKKRASFQEEDPVHEPPGVTQLSGDFGGDLGDAIFADPGGEGASADLPPGGADFHGAADLHDDFGLDALGYGAPPSALDAALERQRAEHATNAGAFGFESAMDAEEKISALAAARGGDLGLSALSGGEVRRGFSFSLQDMAEEFSPQRHSSGGVHHLPARSGTPSAPAQVAAARGARQTWNPLAEIGRHWDERPGEVVGIPPPSSLRPASSLSLATRSTLGPPAGEVGAWTSTEAAGALNNTKSSLLCDNTTPATIEEELEQREERVAALRKRISQLEADLQSGAPTTPTADPPPVSANADTDGPRRIVVPSPLDGEKMGLTIKHMTVTEVSDIRALNFGWAAGDRILQVNGFPVTNMHELSAELAKAISSYKVSGRPLIFEVWRQAGAAQASDPKLPAASTPDPKSVTARASRPPRRREACCGAEDEPRRPTARAAAAPIVPTAKAAAAPAPPAAHVAAAQHPPATAPAVHTVAPPSPVGVPQTAPMQLVYQYQPGLYAIPAQSAIGAPTAVTPSAVRPQVYQAAPVAYHTGVPVSASTAIAPHANYR